MTTPLKNSLDEYQQKAVDTLLKKSNMILVAPCGSGKTIIFTELINRLYKHHGKILLIAPKNVLASGYIETFERHLHPDITFGIFPCDSQVIMINRESIHKVKDISFQVVLIDECSLFKTSRGVHYKHLKHIINLNCGGMNPCICLCII